MKLRTETSMIIMRRKDGLGREIFSSVMIDRCEESEFVEKTTEAGTFVRVL